MEDQGRMYRRDEPWCPTARRNLTTSWANVLAFDWDEVGHGCTGHSERNSSATTSAIDQMEHSLPLLSFWTSGGMVSNGSWQEWNTEIVNCRRATAGCADCVPRGIRPLRGLGDGKPYKAGHWRISCIASTSWRLAPAVPQAYTWTRRPPTST